MIEKTYSTEDLERANYQTKAKIKMLESLGSRRSVEQDTSLKALRRFRKEVKTELANRIHQNRIPGF